MPIVLYSDPVRRERRPIQPVFATATKTKEKRTVIDIRKYYATAWLPKRTFEGLAIVDIEAVRRLCRRKLVSYPFYDGMCFRYPHFPSEQTSFKENMLWQAFREFVGIYLPHYEITSDQMRRIFEIE